MFQSVASWKPAAPVAWRGTQIERLCEASLSRSQPGSNNLTNQQNQHRGMGLKMCHLQGQIHRNCAQGHLWQITTALWFCNPVISITIYEYAWGPEKGRLITSFRTNQLDSTDRLMNHPRDKQGVSKNTESSPLAIFISLINFCPTEHFHLGY